MYNQSSSLQNRGLNSLPHFPMSTDPAYIYSWHAHLSSFSNLLSSMLRNVLNPGLQPKFIMKNTVPASLFPFVSCSVIIADNFSKIYSNYQSHYRQLFQIKYRLQNKISAWGNVQTFIFWYSRLNPLKIRLLGRWKVNQGWWDLGTKK